MPTAAVQEMPRLPIERQDAIALLRSMLLIRRFEEKSAELYTLGKILGFLHLYIGEEAVAVGAMTAFTPDDAIVSTYREHGHALARGMSAGAVMAEMYGKANGCSRGRGACRCASNDCCEDRRSQRSRSSCVADFRRAGP
jgi:TPP-dependent pyruvate/acetoin dehydrogenase alpha subunit